MQKTDKRFSEPLSVALEAALNHLSNLDSNSVAATATTAELRARLRRPLTKEGLASRQVIEELAADVRGGLLGSASGRFFGWVIGGTLPAAMAADWLTSAWDQNAVLYATSPAAAIIEETVGGWLKDILGLPASASFALPSGCQMAHVTCLAAARHYLLLQRGWDVETQGLYGAPRMRILASAQQHGSIQRAVRLLGLGSSQITGLRTDTMGRVQPQALKRELSNDVSSPTIVTLQAGDISTGACDDFEALVPIAKARGVWVHVDGAFGLWAAASPKYKHLVQGVEQADSWTIDGHKWLSVPFDCGYAFVAHPEAHRASMCFSAPYFTLNNEVRDQMDWTPEWSRRARGFPTYAALRQLGRDGVADLIERCCRHARSLVTRIGQLPGAEVLCEPTLNQGLVRFLDLRSDATETDHARQTDLVICNVAASGEAYQQ
jgi:glutamate/tyrosine decarboxylase-like PLP-dependent enzyme